MKKIRYVPYGYAVRNGLTIIATDEARIVREIFEQYIDGASLKDIAEDLTAKQIPYTEKTTTWDKARIARIIDNAKYTGTAEYEPIIEEETYEYALNVKTARQRGSAESVCHGIDTIRDRIRCGECGSMMMRRTCQKCKIRESWTCTNPKCGMRIRIADRTLLEKVQTILNRIIRNTALLIPCERSKKDFETPEIGELKTLLNREMERDTPNEDRIISLIQGIASAEYQHSDAKDEIAIRLARQQMEMQKESDVFQPPIFQNIAKMIVLYKDGTIAVNTKTEAKIKEIADGSQEDT